MAVTYPLNLPIPLVAGYSQSDAVKVAMNNTVVGPPRVELISEYGSPMFDVSWLFSASQFKVFEGWFKYDLTFGSRSFDMLLKVGAGLISQELYFDAGKSYKASLKGKLWMVKAKLIGIDKNYGTQADYDQAIIDLDQESNGFGFDTADLAITNTLEIDLDTSSLSLTLAAGKFVAYNLTYGAALEAQTIINTGTGLDLFFYSGSASPYTLDQTELAIDSITNNIFNYGLSQIVLLVFRANGSDRNLQFDINAVVAPPISAQQAAINAAAVIGIDTFSGFNDVIPLNTWKAWQLLPSDIGNSNGNVTLWTGQNVTVETWQKISGVDSLLLSSGAGLNSPASFDGALISASATNFYALIFNNNPDQPIEIIMPSPEIPIVTELGAIASPAQVGDYNINFSNSVAVGAGSWVAFEIATLTSYLTTASIEAAGTLGLTISAWETIAGVSTEIGSVANVANTLQKTLGAANVSATNIYILVKNTTTISQTVSIFTAD